MTQNVYEQKFLNHHGATDTNRSDLSSYKDYVVTNYEYLQLTRSLEIQPCVAAYALISTDFRSIDAALNFIYEREEAVGDALVRVHPFVGCIPLSKEFTSKNAEQDLELGDPNRFKVCFICQGNRLEHKSELDNSVKEEKDMQMLKLIKDNSHAALTFPPISLIDFFYPHEDTIFKRKALINNFNRRITETRERIIKQLDEEKY